MLPIKGNSFHFMIASGTRSFKEAKTTTKGKEDSMAPYLLCIRE
jgi:hypothetical protein